MKPFGVKQIPFILFSVLPIFSCGDSLFSDRSDDGAISVVCTTPAEPVEKPAVATIRADLSVSDAAGALLAASALSMNGLTASGKVKVKNGTGYRVDIKGYDSLNNLTYYGSASNVTVEAGKTTVVSITLVKVGATTVTIWGFVFGADGITVTLSGDSTGSKTLNNGDQYSFSVPSGGSYTVTLVKEGYTFIPDTFTFTNISSNQQRNFSGSKITLTLSGTVTGADSVVVALTGDAGSSQTVNSGGTYSFTVTYGGNYTVTPLKTGYEFTPASKSFTNVRANQTQDFTATKQTFTISGTVSGADEVIVTLSGNATATQMVNSGGTYSFTVAYGGNYTVTPTKTGYVFVPASKSFTNVTTNQTQNFAGSKILYILSGVVTGADGVTVTLSGDASATQTVNDGGTYSFNVVYGGTYTVTPSKTGYVFVPANKSFTNVTANQTQNFAASKQTFTLSGKITGADGVTVTLSGDASATQTVNDGGTYSFSVAYGGTYTVTPSKDGYVFTPTNKVFTNVMANQTQNFTGFKNNDGSIHIDIPAGTQAISYMTAYVYSSGSEVTRKNLVHTGSRGQADITITAKDNYRVVLAAFDSTLVKYVGSDEDVDVTAGGTTNVDIAMVNITPTMKSPIVTGNNSFSINWTSNIFATAYKLEEDDNNSFTSPITVSSSADTTVSFTNKSAGSYFYRVCCITPYGNSPWSEVKSVGVSGEGTIHIDIPWPE